MDNVLTKMAIRERKEKDHYENVGLAQSMEPINWEEKREIRKK